MLFNFNFLVMIKKAKSYINKISKACGVGDNMCFTSSKKKS